MRPYQQEYIANIREIIALTKRKTPADRTLADYTARLRRDEARREEIVGRNMELLRLELLPELDDLPEAPEGELEELRQFAGELLGAGKELDAGLFFHIRQSLLGLARQKGDRPAIIRELYWLGIGRHSLCNSRLVGLELPLVEPYMSEMRLYFTEAAAYLKYFDQIDDEEARGYILRSTANRSLGRFRFTSDRTRLIKRAIQILQDKYYQDMAPALPWKAYIRAVHELMASSISYSKEHAMAPQDVADIMESVHIVYNRQLQAAQERGEPMPAQQIFHYHAIDYYCGVEELGSLLTKMEALMDRADSRDFSKRGMYALISLPAFYCQYLMEYPERISEREEYIAELYRRVLNYLEVFPETEESEVLFLYLRQLCYTFVETEHSIPYGEFLQRLIIRFAPDIYIHARMTAEAAGALCGLILEEEPGFFDDIEELRAIAGPEEKRRAALDYARGCGLFHDVGKINFVDLYTRIGRQWFEEEYELVRLHADAGGTLLSPRPSTSRYAAAALGHHAWYDGSSRGYPAAYRRLDHPERQMVDVIALVDWLVEVTDTARLYTGLEMSFDEAVGAAIAQEGSRFSPLLTARLRDRRVAEEIARAFAAGRESACRQMYEAASRREALHTPL